MAALGAVKGVADQDRERRDRILAAQTQRYSPWTKLQAQQVQAATSPLAGAIGGYASGAGQMDAFNRAEAERNYYKMLQAKLMGQQANG